MVEQKSLLVGVKDRLIDGPADVDETMVGSNDDEGEVDGSS